MTVMGHKKGLYRRSHLGIEHLERRLALSFEPVIVENVDDQNGYDLSEYLVLTRMPDGTFHVEMKKDISQLRIPHNLNAADTANANNLWLGGGLGLDLSGDGVSIGLWDVGSPRTSHTEFGGRVSNVDGSSVDSHSTHVAGTIAAAGLYGPAHGMAAQATIRSHDFNSDYAELRSDAQAGLISLSNHSYGYPQGWTKSGSIDIWVGDRTLYTEAQGFGKYNADSQTLDDVLADNPALLSVWAAGNDADDAFTDGLGLNLYYTYYNGLWDFYPNSGATAAPGPDGGLNGFDTLSHDQVAKNNLVVGSVGDITADPYTSGSISISSFSSRGGTDDGRIKPDVVANGELLTSTWSTGDNIYANDSGTSMAAPSVTGTAALLLEHYRNLNSGADPTAATLKGLLIHTAADAGNVGPDYTYGWGLVNGAAAATLLSNADASVPTAYVKQNTYSGSEYTFDVHLQAGQPLKATIAWTDPAPIMLPGTGLDVSTSVLVNDLDIWITGPGGTYRPWTLDPANPGNAAVRTSANHRDNVEQVLIDAPAAGTYTIHVGRTGSSFTQNYSLIVSGNIDNVAPQIVSISPAAGSVITSTTMNVDVTYSESVTNVDPSDLNVINSSSFAFMGTVTSVSAQNVQQTIWRFQVSLFSANGEAAWLLLTSGVTDLAGNAPASGSPTTISIDNMGPAVTSVVAATTTTDHLPYAFPAGSGIQTATTPVAETNKLTIRFNEHINLQQSDLQLTNSSGGTITTTSFSTSQNGQFEFPVWFEATWTFPSLGVGQFSFKLLSGSSNVRDTKGNWLDGEWDNPTSRADSSSDSFPSGNGTPGGHFIFSFTILPGDSSQDNYVDGIDYNTWANNFNDPGVFYFTDGDWTGDSTVNGADYISWANHFHVDLRGSTYVMAAMMPGQDFGIGPKAARNYVQWMYESGERDWRLDARRFLSYFRPEFERATDQALESEFFEFEWLDALSEG